MSNDITRDAFETWHKKRAEMLSVKIELTKNQFIADGCEDSPHTHQRALLDVISKVDETGWEAWQAATEQGKRQPPAGYQLVPIEPTQAMIEAGEAQTEIYYSMPDDFLRSYKAAIAAAPTLPLTATPQGNP